MKYKGCTFVHCTFWPDNYVDWKTIYYTESAIDSAMFLELHLSWKPHATLKKMDWNRYFYTVMEKLYKIYKVSHKFGIIGKVHTK